jgi:FkbH-like protein
MHMNIRLAAAFDGHPSIFVLNAQRWWSAGHFSPKLWHMAKVGLSREIFREAAADIRAALRGLGGTARKLVVVDLDDTLWGGVVGDVGWENLRLGGHDGLGEAFADFQHQLKALTRRGVLLAIASKNDESVALAAVANHPEMVLRSHDFAAYRINWQDKAQNIVDIARELNIGLQSVVFIDDNRVERARVRETLPEVFVPEWPEDTFLSATALLGLRCFDTPHVTREDAQRGTLYDVERKRSGDKERFRSLDEWLIGLETCVRFSPLDAANLPRVTQLLNKTNQMNLQTRRLTETELTRWAVEAGRELWAIHVSDKYGDSGLTGILSLEPREDRVVMTDFVLSCRVMGRKVEEAMVAAAVHRARERGGRLLVAPFLRTDKNAPCFDFWRRSGFAFGEHEMDFSWDPVNTYFVPRCISVAGLALTSEPLSRSGGLVTLAATCDG